MRRVIIIGLDGAEPSLVVPWMDAGILPSLAALRERGGYMPCRSTMPPATFPAWSTCVTGVNPGKHGIFDFTEIVPGKYALRFLNATFRRVPALWNILSEAGRHVGILGVPATYPPEKVRGFMVSGFDTPVTTRIDRTFVFPTAEYERFRNWVFADFQESRIGSGWHAEALKKLHDAIRIKTSLCLDCLKREPWDFFMVVFGESDTVAHHFWAFHDPHSPRYVPDSPWQTAVLSIYQQLDKALGAIMNTIDDGNTLILVVSDHGFGGAGTGVVHLNNYLAEQGFLRFRKSPRKNLLKSLALAAVPSAWQGRLFRAFPNAAARLESTSRFGSIDWAHTRAWSEELNYFPSVRINLAGREPSGQVTPADYEKVRGDVIAALQAWHPVRRAWRREEVYVGAFVDHAPDIVLELELEQGYSYSCLRSSPGCSSFRRIRPEERLGGKERGMTGNHRQNGILLLSEKPTRHTASLEDVAPTVLDYLGVSGPPMDGQSLLGGVTMPSAEKLGGEPVPYTAEQEKMLEERLRALGYWE